MKEDIGDFRVLWNDFPYFFLSDFNIGDFPIPGDSYWRLTITDPGNQINQVEYVLGPEVPNDLSDFEAVSSGDLGGQLTIDGLTVTFNFNDVSMSVAGSGDIGTVISGNISGSIVMNGTVNDQTYNNYTINFNTSYNWERIPPG